MESWEDWQKLYRFGTIVISPPDEVRKFVNAQREKYDPVSQACCEAHVSITQPLGRRLGSDEWHHVSNLLRRHESFEVRFGPVKSFLPYPCIWYEIQPSEKILNIRSALHQTGFFNLAMKHPETFIPHMTITEGLSGPPVDQGLLDQIAAEGATGTFLCESLSYIIPNQEFHFELASTLPLGEPTSRLAGIDGR